MSAIISWHPTLAFFHDPFERGAFQVDLDRFARLLHGKLEPSPKLVLNPSARQVKSLHNWALRMYQPIACDIETAAEKGDHEGHTGKNPLRARLKGIGLGNERLGLSHWWQGKNTASAKAILALLADKRVVKVFQNGDWFDLRLLRRLGIAVENIVDTRDARRAVSATSKLNLGYMTTLYSDFAAWKSDEDTK